MNLLKTVALLGFLSALLVVIGYLLIGGKMGAIVGLGIAVVINFGSWFYSDQIALAVYGAKPASGSQAQLLKPMVEVLCYRANLPLPKIYVIPTLAANAFATGRDPEHAAIALTQGIINMLSEDELEAVIAHELSHVKNRDTLTQAVAATIAGAISMLTELASHRIWFFGTRNTRGNPLTSLLIVLTAPIVATVIQMSLSRTREYAADAGAAKLTRNPRALANALKKLENNTRQMPMQGNPAFAPLLIINSFSNNFMSRLFSTHPPTQARVEQLLNMEAGLQSKFSGKKNFKSQLRNRAVTSVAIILAALGLTYVPIPGMQQTVVIVSGTELQEPLKAIEAKFEQENPSIKLDLKFQGSQDIVNNYIDQKNDFKPTVIIPSSGEFVKELSQRWKAQNNSDPFYETPQPIAKTIMVGVAWPERGKVLFPNGRFQWQRVEQAMQAGNWAVIGGSSNWGSFDFVTTDPTRSNSGQVTLGLWAQSKLGGASLSSATLNNPAIQSLFGLVKRSVYQPPRSTDILLQEFIARGPNDADVATVYESIALYRWQQSGANQGKPYQVYYLDPTVETVSTAAILRQDVSAQTAQAARKFLEFLTQPSQQATFVQYGFRPVVGSVDLKSVANSPWANNIPGAEVNPPGRLIPSPDAQVLAEIKRLWERGS